MGGVSNIGPARFTLPGSYLARPFELRKVVLPRITSRHFPTYNDGMSVGQQALERVRKANLAAAAAIYAYQQMAPG